MLYSIPKKDLDALRESLSAGLADRLGAIVAGLEIMLTLELAAMEERLAARQDRARARRLDRSAT